jgi:hypothetical protein
MPWTKEDRSFKILVSRRTTSSNKAYYEEYGDNTINVHLDTVWSQSISSDPATAVSQGVAEQKTLLTLTEDVSVGSQQSYYAQVDGTRLKDWISDKYGDDYKIHLYQNSGSEIFPTDVSQWFFDNPTGILTFDADTGSFTKPFKVSGYRYIGQKGAVSAIPFATDTTGGKVYIANNNQTPTLSPTALRADDSRVLRWDPTNLGTHFFIGDASVARDATIGHNLYVDSTVRIGTLSLTKNSLTSTETFRFMAPDATATGSLRITNNMTVDGTMVIGPLTMPTYDGTSEQILKTDGTGRLSWTNKPTSTDLLSGKEITEIYDVSTSSPATFYLNYIPMNSSSVRMIPEGGIELVNSVDFSMSLNVVSYIAPAPTFEIGDRIIFEYIRQ